TQVVIVNDDTPPAISPMPDLVTFTGAGSTSCAIVVTDAALGAATAIDNVSGAVPVRRAGVPAGNTFPVGTTTITYTAADPSGNVATTTQTVIVVDDTLPAIAAPANTSYELPSLVPAARPSDATASDNCGAVT